METQTQQPKQQFQLQHLYIKESTCKSPRAPSIFVQPDFIQNNVPPTTSFEMQVKHQPIAASQYEVTLHLIVNVKVKETTAYTLDIQQAGIFQCEGYEESQLDYLLKAYCPNLLYPYVSHAVAEASMQAGFPPLRLSPMNFEHLYQQQKDQPKGDNSTPLHPH